jgi:hypothetical protein
MPTAHVSGTLAGFLFLQYSNDLFFSKSLLHESFLWVGLYQIMEEFLGLRSVMT